MLYEIHVEDGRITETRDNETTIQPKLFKYRFFRELFEVLSNYKIICIDISELYIIIGTVKNEIAIFTNNQSFDKIGLYKFNKDIMLRELIFNEIDNTLHIVDNKNEYNIYELLLMTDKIELRKICDEVNVVNIFLNKVKNKCLVIFKNGDCKLFCDIRSKIDQLLLSNQEIIENTKINVIWSYNEDLVLWSIDFRLYLYNYNINKMLLIVNLRNQLIFNERMDLNKMTLYYNMNNIYIIIKNKIYLCRLSKRNGNRYKYNISLVYKLSNIYSLIDISNIEVTQLNSNYTCIISILNNSKDQLNLFIFDDYFRIIKHDVIYCRKYILNEIKIDDYVKDTNYVNLELLHNMPRFLKLRKNQLLIHKNKNKSFLIMEYNDDEIHQYYIKNNLVNKSLIILSYNIAKQTETYFIIKYLEQNSPNISIELIDKILYKYSIIENSSEEFDIYIDLFKYYGKLFEFVHFIGESLYFIKLFNAIKDNNWYLNFLMLLFNENIDLFYYAICKLPIRRIIEEFSYNSELYSTLLLNIEKDTSKQLKIYCDCNCGFTNEPFKVDKINMFQKKEIYYYLSYVELLSWNKFSHSETMKYYLHLLSKFSNNKIIEDKIMYYFKIYYFDYSDQIKQFINENINCILNTSNYNIINSFIFSNIENNLILYYNLIKDNDYISFIFITSLIKYYQSYTNESSIKFNGINSNQTYKINESDKISTFLNSKFIYITKLYLIYSKHFLLDHIIMNHNLLNCYQLMEIINSYSKNNELKSDINYKFIIEAKSIIFFLLNDKIEAIIYLLDFGLIYSCLSLILYFNPENESLWKSFLNILFDQNNNYQKQIEELLYWFEFYLYNPIKQSEETENNFIENISNLIFPKNQYYYNMLKIHNNKENDLLINCCNWHNIPFNFKHINQNIKNIILNNINFLKKNINGNLLNDELCQYKNIHEKYLKLQLHLLCSSFDYYNEEMNRKTTECINNIKKAVIINHNRDLCSLCNLKLFYFKNKKISNKVIVNYCNHNYHYECFIQNIHLNEKSHKFKVNIENNICKSNMKCIICQYKKTIDG